MLLSTRAGILICVAAGMVSADTLTLRSGETVQGTWLGGDTRQVRMDLRGEIRTYDISLIQSVTFTNSPSYQPSRSQVQPEPPRPQITAPDPPPDRRPQDIARDRERDRDRDRDRDSDSRSSGVVIPVDTTVSIRMIESVDSETARLGQTFRASLDEPIMVDGREVVPRGADVLTKLVADEQSGKIQGRTVLTLGLSTITVNGQVVDVTSSDVETASGSRSARSGKVIGGTAALGAIIGAIAGGGKGAAIGAGSGAAVGTGAQVLTAGQRVRIPSETRLTFRLQNPLRL
jgi:hypothetical protein